MTIMVYLVVFQIALFAVLVFGIRQLLLNNTLKAAAKLREAESELGRKEDAVRKRIEENETEFRRKSAEAQEQLARVKEAMEKDVAKSRDALLDEARKERDRIMDEASRNKERLRQELMREAQVQILDHVAQVYEMVFSAEVGQSVNNAFLDELFAALEEMDASSITIAAPVIEVTSSHPLDKAHHERIVDIVHRKFDARLEIRESVDANLIAGMRIKLGSLEIDGSLKNRFQEAIDQLKSEHL